MKLDLLQASYSSGISSAPLLGETIDNNLRHTVNHYPDHEAIVEMQTGRRLTYSQLDGMIDVVARGMLAHGVHRAIRSSRARGFPGRTGDGSRALLMLPIANRRWSIIES